MKKLTLCSTLFAALFALPAFAGTPLTPPDVTYTQPGLDPEKGAVTLMDDQGSASKVLFKTDHEISLDMKSTRVVVDFSDPRNLPNSDFDIPTPDAAIFKQGTERTEQKYQILVPTTLAYTERNERVSSNPYQVYDPLNPYVSPTERVPTYVVSADNVQIKNLSTGQIMDMKTYLKAVSKEMARQDELKTGNYGYGLGLLDKAYDALHGLGTFASSAKSSDTLGAKQLPAPAAQPVGATIEIHTAAAASSN